MKKYISIPIKGYERVLAFFGLISEEFIISNVVSNNTLNTVSNTKEIETIDNITVDSIVKPQDIPFFDLSEKSKVKKSNF